MESERPLTWEQYRERQEMRAIIRRMVRRHLRYAFRRDCGK